MIHTVVQGTGPTRLLAPDEKCCGTYHDHGVRIDKLWGICLRCARLSRAGTQLGQVYINRAHGQHVAECRAVLYGGAS